MAEKEVPDREEAYGKSIGLLKECSTPYGFRAALGGGERYARVWGRDSMICSLAALLTEEKKLINQVERSLRTLIKFQYKHGQIPSNVDAKKEKVSYGGTAGRVDAHLWFLIGFGQYVKKTKNKKFLKKYYKNFKKTAELVHLYEFNDKHLIYVPKGGDWADEYVQEGYVLYDQLLYYQSIKEYIYVRNVLRKSTTELREKLEAVRRVIKANYGIDKKKIESPFIYHKMLYERAAKKKVYRKPYMMPYFNPSGYGSQFDGFANSLALLVGCVEEGKRDKIVKYVDKIAVRGLLPAFYPPIKPGEKDWEELRYNYSVKFRNAPGEYHNGGLWPMITGFFASAVRDNPKICFKFLDGVNSANQKNNWGFYEFLNGKTGKTGGTRNQAWSAAAGVMAYETILKKKDLFK